MIYCSLKTVIINNYHKKHSNLCDVKECKDTPVILFLGEYSRGITVAWFRSSVSSVLLFFERF